MYEKWCGVCEKFSFAEVSYVYVMVSRLKEIYRTNTIVSSISYVWGTLFTEIVFVKGIAFGDTLQQVILRSKGREGITKKYLKWA